MNALQTFVAACPGGYIVAAQVAELVSLDRLCPLLVRCGCCRFTCPAQDLEHLKRCIDLGGDYVRDVSFTAGIHERAAGWVPEPTPTGSPRKLSTGAQMHGWKGGAQ